MKIKSKWVYCYGKGLRGASVSNRHHIIGDNMYFAFTYGQFPWHGFILELNLTTQECRTVYAEKHIVGSPGLYEEGKFYFTSYRGVALCVDVNGNLLWETKIGKGNPSREVLIDGDRLYASNNSLFCLNKNTGKILFFDPEKGELTNLVRAKGRLYREPVFEQGKLYIGDANDVMNSTAGNMTCYEVNGDELKEVFSVTVGGGISTKAVLNGDRLFFAAEDGYLYCIDKNTGEGLMTRKKTKGVCRDVIVRGEELIVLSDKGQVECFAIE
ncbi:MAG: PQQ-binding-like beta-propeller repeat protein [Clostridium sp.]|nr:PQQ-binding-like beta-propeller repeat protein [Clostridium sp.]